MMDCAAKEAEPESRCNGFEPVNPALKRIWKVRLIGMAAPWKGAG